MCIEGWEVKDSQAYRPLVDESLLVDFVLSFGINAGDGVYSGLD
jgi:hypothetical protein